MLWNMIISLMVVLVGVERSAVQRELVLTAE